MRTPLKRRLRRGVALLALLALVAILGANTLIPKEVKGRTYSDVASVPHRKVGLVLGPHIEIGANVPTKKLSRPMPSWEMSHERPVCR